MKCFFKTVVVLGLVGLGTVALAHVVLGKQRTHGAIHALQGMARDEVDKLIASQNDMKHELETLRAEYPKQIALLRSQLMEVEQQLANISRAETRAKDILTLCDADISALKAAQGESSGVVEFRGSRYSPAQIKSVLARVSGTRQVYEVKLADAASERAALDQERADLTARLADLRAEQAEFEAQYQGLLREIERVNRNEQVLAITEKRAAHGVDRHSENMTTLSKVQQALQRARIEQEERLKAAQASPRNLDYEARARALEAEREREAKRATQPTPESDESAEELADTNADDLEDSIEGLMLTK